MPKVTYICADGTTKIVEGSEGATILQIALSNGIPLEHACGGNGFCTTCSCDVKDGQAMIDHGFVSPVNEREENMGVEGPDRRLGCQTKVHGDVTVQIVEV
ncbi:MAG TPA: 2Fe-2S iron-sulfur cluster-binding protein [Candidatus Peribacterales bacterium]|nr:2Fe-2S iron-sulfur cluster-binding protein [Candidatus Peribacterales bacterium]